MKAKLGPFKLISSDKQPYFRDILLEIHNLRKIFHINESFLTALENISFSVKRGEIVCILGRSGCGKSTLLKILAGFLAPGSGEVLINGRAIGKPGPDRCVVFQEDALFPWLTVKENISFGFKGLKKNKKEVQKETERYLSLVGLTEFKDYLPSEISGGMKQRVALARVLILKPELLLMDEPFAGLDAQSREEMQDLLLSLWKKLSHTIIFVTHDVSEALTLADRILVMSKSPGRIQKEICVNLSRPRQKEKSDFAILTQKLCEELRR